MKVWLSFGAALLTGAVALSGAAFGETEIIKMRQQLMESNQQAAKVASLMIRGTIPYDASVLEVLMNQIALETGIFPKLLLDSDKTNPTSNALLAAYSEAAKLKTIAQKMSKDALAAADSASKGVDAFRKAFGEVAGNCEDCHESFRKP